MSEPRVLWITGAGSGMGRAAALEAARTGWRVALSGRSTASLDQVRGEIEAAGGSAVTVPLDVTDRDQVGRAHTEVAAVWGRIDALVLSAGLNSPQRTWADQTMASFDQIVATNLTAVASVIDVALPDLRAAGHGVVVVVSSYAGWQFNPGAGVAYSASKSALASIVIMLNKQEARSGIRATHLCPGDVATGFLQQRPVVPDAAAQAVMLTAEDVGRAVGFVLESPPYVRVDELVISPISQV